MRFEMAQTEGGGKAISLANVIPASIVAVMLLIAVAELPYGYYQVLRWATCGIGVFIAFRAYKVGTTWITWLFGLIAVLFNPIFPIHLTKEIWRPIDLTCALLFGLSILLLLNPVKKKGR